MGIWLVLEQNVDVDIRGGKELIQYLYPVSRMYTVVNQNGWDYLLKKNSKYIKKEHSRIFLLGLFMEMLQFLFGFCITNVYVIYCEINYNI